jgi:hypothetical protein
MSALILIFIGTLESDSVLDFETQVVHNMRADARTTHNTPKTLWIRILAT